MTKRVTTKVKHKAMRIKEVTREDFANVKWKRLTKEEFVNYNFDNREVGEHNHALLSNKFHDMLPGHRRMDDAKIRQMNEMRYVGIGTPSLYQSLAKQSGGFERVGFHVHDMYNEIGQLPDVKGFTLN
ncbi:protein FAR1-RELATED SEQUENCE 5-like [Sesbania bispinosa]|nr:protein FAR1-RELATED SEQUENCE 5-like [Sesbania bispinosa]